MHLRRKLIQTLAIVLDNDQEYLATQHYPVPAGVAFVKPGETKSLGKLKALAT